MLKATHPERARIVTNRWTSRPWLNGWALFWLITAPISVALIAATLATDTSQGAGVSHLVGVSVRCAIPWLYLAFAASAVQILRPGAFSLWLLRNRKVFGLAFAAVMGWQAFFILWLVLGHTDYYVQEVYLLRDAIEGVVGYAFLLAMTATSFMPVRRRMRPKTWKWLHTIGIYSLWIYAYAVYWWAHAYYEQPDAIDYLYYWGGFFAWALRCLAWRKKRLQRAFREDPHRVTVKPLAMLGVGLAAVGLGAVATGPWWQAGSEALLYGHAPTLWAERLLPYWPFEPFLPLVLVGAGAWLTTAVRPTSPGRLAATH